MNLETNMTAILRLAVCAAFLGSPLVALADVSESFVASGSGNPNSGLRGRHIDRPSAETGPHGFSLDIGGGALWELGLYTDGPSGLHDFGLYSHSTQSL